MADADVERIGRDLIESLGRAMDTMGAEVTRAVQVDISTPTGIHVGPRGGIYTIRSKPGENPRLDTGRLHDSITYEVATASEQVTLTVFTDVEYAAYLESSRLDRPIMEPTFDEYESTIGDRLASMIADF